MAKTKSAPKSTPGEVPGKTKMTFYITDWICEKIHLWPSKRFSENVENSLIEANSWKRPREKKLEKKV